MVSRGSVHPWAKWHDRSSTCPLLRFLVVLAQQVSPVRPPAVFTAVEINRRQRPQGFRLTTPPPKDDNPPVPSIEVAVPFRLEKPRQNRLRVPNTTGPSLVGSSVSVAIRRSTISPGHNSSCCP